MSMNFDSVNYLEEALQPDELHLLTLLTDTPTKNVKVRKEVGRLLVTLPGIMQGYCLSATLFILYFVYIPLKERTTQDTVLIKPKYADDITYATNDENTYQEIRLQAPSLL